MVSPVKSPRSPSEKRRNNKHKVEDSLAHIEKSLKKINKTMNTILKTLDIHVRSEKSKNTGNVSKPANVTVNNRNRMNANARMASTEASVETPVVIEPFKTSNNASMTPVSANAGNSMNINSSKPSNSAVNMNAPKPANAASANAGNSMNSPINTGRSNSNNTTRVSFNTQNPMNAPVIQTITPSTNVASNVTPSTNVVSSNSQVPANSAMTNASANVVPSNTGVNQSTSEGTSETPLTGGKSRRHKKHRKH